MEEQMTLRLVGSHACKTGAASAARRFAPDQNTSTNEAGQEPSSFWARRHDRKNIKLIPTFVAIG